MIRRAICCIGFAIWNPIVMGVIAWIAAARASIMAECNNGDDWA